MKKTMLTLMATLLLCLTSGAWAQRAAYYHFEAANGAADAAYTPLNGTELGGLADLPTGLCDDYAWVSASEFKAFGDIAEETVLTGIPIGFDFPYADQTFTHFVPTTEGYIALVKATGAKKADIVPVGKDYAPYGIGLRASGPVYKSAATKVSYKAEAGMLSVEFAGFHYDTAKTGETYTVNEALSVNYTLRLYPDGKVAFYFGEMKGESKSGWDANVNFGIGLNEAGSEENHIHYRGPGGSWSAPDWTATVQKDFVNNCTMGDGAKFIPVGTVWTFTQPAPCAAPAASVTGTVDYIRPEGFLVVHDVAEDVADGYVTFVSEGPLTEGVEPENGKSYTYGDQIGTAEYGGGDDELTQMNIRIDDIDRQSDYYVYTYLYNERCKGVRTYGGRPTPAILISAPQLAMTYENDKISLFPKGNDSLVVLATTVNGEKDINNNIGNVGRFGIPTAGHKVGDTVWTSDKNFGGIVIYKGLEPTAAFDYAGPLKPFTNYHFAAFRRDAAGGYVSFFAQADTLTPPVIPFFDDFSTSVAYAEPQGYAGNGQFQVQGRGGLQAQITANSTGEAARLRLETPEMVFPAEADARLILDYAYVVMRGFRGMSGSLIEEDYKGDNGIYFSISEAGGDWEQVYAIDKTNPDYFASQNDYKKRFITLSGHQGKPCRIRIEAVGEGFAQAARMYIASISIVEKPACDAPLAVSVLPETVYGDSARMAWQPFDADQNQATMAYRLVDDEIWHTLVDQTSRDTLGLGGLPYRENVVLGVKTLCAGGKESVYTESAAFKTGYQVPFVEDFSVPGIYEGRVPSEQLYALPESWTVSIRSLPETGALRLETNSTTLSLYAPLFDWNTRKAFDPEAAGNNCVRLGGRIDWNESWVVLPPVVLTENHGAVLSFDAALLKGDSTAAVAVSEADIDVDAKLVVYVAPMTASDVLASQTFTADNAVLTLDKAQLAEIGGLKHLEVALTGLSGKVRIGIYYSFGAKNVEATWNRLYLDNIAVAAPCGAVADLKTVTVGETAAEIRWRAYPGVSEYTVTVAEAEGTATPETIAVAEPKAVLTGLEKATAYKVSVSYACADGNAPASEISFTTAGMPCGEPTALTATALTQTSAVLSWTGAAETYKLEFKETAAAEYVQRMVSGTTYTLTNLKAGTGYVFRVQAVCNAAAGDESDWSETAAFKTADLTCFAPTGLKVTPSFSRAEATWEGEADQYQLAYKQGTDAATPWTVVPVAAKQYTLTGLKAETVYSVRVRSICAAGDTSAYSEVVEFTTTIMTACPVPTDLRVEDTAENTAKLAWSGDELHESYLFRYRETTATAWDSVKDLKETAYALGSLKANTVYIWSVNGVCSEGRTSGWATASEFKTLGGVANEALLRAAFELYAAKGSVHLLNRRGIYVETVEIHAVDGRLLRREAVRSADHVFLPVAFGGMPVMIVLQTEAGRVAYKILLP